tara:strand:- start:671 stop:1528 length:858 start_codon:yes stop_codon:yes gene_type:complete
MASQILDQFGRPIVQTTALGANVIPSIGEWTKKLTQKPSVQALQEALGEQIKGTAKNIPKGLKGASQVAQGTGVGALQFMAPNAVREASVRGFGAARNVIKAGGGLTALAGPGGTALRQTARVAGIKPAIKIAGRFAGRRVPLIGAGLDLAAGDPLGATGTLAGGAIGGALTLGSPLGIAVGSMVGGPILKGGRQILSPIFGDPSDPLSGRDWSIGGMPITPYAKTKRNMEKQAKLYADIQLPLMEQINNAQLEREMKMAKLGMLQNMMSSTNSLMSQAFQAGAY